MKKANLIKALFLTIVVVFSSCSGSNNSVKDPEMIGRQVFKILQNISDGTRQEYIDQYLSIEEIRELGKNPDIITDESTRNEMTSMLREKWIDGIKNEYNEIKEDGGEAAINWQEIEYLDFVFEITEEDGIQFCEGELYFKLNNRSFNIAITSLYNGKEYKLITIEDLYEQ